MSEREKHLLKMPGYKPGRPTVCQPSEARKALAPLPYSVAKTLVEFDQREAQHGERQD